MIGSTIIVVNVAAGQSECRCRNQGLPGFQLSQNVDICGYVKLPLPCLVALLVESIYPAFFGVKSCQPGNGCCAIRVHINNGTQKLLGDRHALG
jgi:hypothetical protein